MKAIKTMYKNNEYKNDDKSNIKMTKTTKLLKL